MLDLFMTRQSARSFCPLLTGTHYMYVERTMAESIGTCMWMQSICSRSYGHQGQSTLARTNADRQGM